MSTRFELGTVRALADPKMRVTSLSSGHQRGFLAGPRFVQKNDIVFGDIGRY